jgi:hypothetical protein
MFSDAPLATTTFSGLGTEPNIPDQNPDWQEITAGSDMWTEITTGTGDWSEGSIDN